MFALVLVPLYLFTSTVNAVKFYGHAPSQNAYTSFMSHLAQPMGDSFSFGSVFTSSDLASQNGPVFLADHGIPNMMLVDLVTQGKGLHVSPMPSSELSTRDPADSLNCQGSAVVDKISPTRQHDICDAISALVAGGVVSVGAVVDNTVCSEQSTGHPVKCHTIVACHRSNWLLYTLKNQSPLH